MSVNLSIKDVPEQLAASLRQRAARNHRSLQGELMAIIESAAKTGDQASLPILSAGLSAGAVRPTASERRGHLTVEETAAALRERFPQPVAGGPLAVDIVRADRDSR